MKTKLLLLSTLLLTSCENVTVEQVYDVGTVVHDTWHIIKGTECIFDSEESSIYLLKEDCGK